MEAVARKGMDKDEASFAVEAPLEAQTFLWSEKYRPRKPRFVHQNSNSFVGVYDCYDLKRNLNNR